MNARNVLAVLVPSVLLILFLGSGVQAAPLGDPTDNIPDLWLRLDPSDHSLSTPSEFEWIDPAGLELNSFYITSVAGIFTGNGTPNINIGDGGPGGWVEGWGLLENSDVRFGESNLDDNYPRTAIREPDFIGRDPSTQPWVSNPMVAIGSAWQWADPDAAGYVNPLDDLTWMYTVSEVAGGPWPGHVIVSVIPEPSTVVMLLSGAFGLVLLWRRRR